MPGTHQARGKFLLSERVLSLQVPESLHLHFGSPHACSEVCSESGMSAFQTGERESEGLGQSGMERRAI